MFKTVLRSREYDFKKNNPISKCFEHACDLGTYKTEEGILRAQEQPGLQSEFSHPELYNKTLSQ